MQVALYIQVSTCGIWFNIAVNFLCGRYKRTTAAKQISVTGGGKSS